MPEKDAHYYQSELDAGRTIVLIRVAGQEHEVLEILHKYGGMTPRSPNSNTQAETNPPPVSQDMYDPIANRDAGDVMMTPEDHR